MKPTSYCHLFKSWWFNFKNLASILPGNKNKLSDILRIHLYCYLCVVQTTRMCNDSKNAFTRHRMADLSLLQTFVASLMKNNFLYRPSGTPLHISMVVTSSLWTKSTSVFQLTCGRCSSALYPLSVCPWFKVVYCFICSRRRVAVSQYRMICFVLFPSHIHVIIKCNI